jgi:hypothetical protein
MRQGMPEPSRLERVLAIVFTTISTWLLVSVGIFAYLDFPKTSQGWTALGIFLVALVPFCVYLARDGLRIGPPLGKRTAKGAPPLGQPEQPSNNDAGGNAVSKSPPSARAGERGR